MSFSDNLKRIRLERGMSQQSLADAAGVSQTSIYQWEKGIRNPKLEQVRSLAKVLHVTIAELNPDWSSFSKEEIENDFTSAGKVVPRAFSQEVDGQYIEELRKMTKSLSENPHDETIRKQAKELLNSIAVGLGAKNTREFVYNNIIHDLNDLNERGLDKVLRFTRDLILIKKYLRDSSETSDPNAEDDSRNDE